MVVKNINLLMDDNSNIKLVKDEVDETPELHDLRNFVTQLENETGKSKYMNIFCGNDGNTSYVPATGSLLHRNSEFSIP